MKTRYFFEDGIANCETVELFKLEPGGTPFDEHTFLLAEDNENDSLLLQRAFRE
jgi:hypothetical protein